MQIANNYRLSVLLVLVMYSSMALAQKENTETLLETTHLMAYLVAGLMISVFVMIFSNRLFYYKEREVTSQTQRMNAQLALVLGSNKTKVWTYDKARNLFQPLSFQNESGSAMTPIDFSQQYDQDDFQELRRQISAIFARESLSESLLVKGKAPKDTGERQRVYEIHLSILRRDKRNHPTVLLGTQNDITDKQAQLDKSRKLMLRYQTVFNSSLVDMVFYDANGTMTDINDKACESFAVEDKEALLKSRPNLSDVPAMAGIDFRTMDQMYSSSITQIQQIDRPIGELEEDQWGSKIYYEQSMTPIHDLNGELSGIVMAGRNITDMVNSHHHQQESTMQLEKNTKNIQEYINNINYSLRVSDVRLMNYFPDTHELEIFSDLQKSQYRIPQLNAIALVRESDRRRAKGLFRRMDRRRTGSISSTLRTIMHDNQGRDVFLNFNVMPIFDKDGHITHYFGMCRNETEMTYTEQKLREETEKAQDTEKLKNLFLLNMSYELRTPLSAVIGFAELFNGEHSPEDEPVFAEEIRKNTGELLNLINAILFISRLDAKMIEFNYAQEDFAALFDGWCYMGWSALSPGVKVIVDNPYAHLVTKIDTQNLSMVIEKLCQFSSDSTQEGIIRAKYEYRHGELMITIEDTGKGFSQAMLPKVFDRFVRDEHNTLLGTGLDLPIIKELTEQMGGTIELQSEPGKGTTFFVSFPCEAITIEKKSEIIV